MNALTPERQHLVTDNLPLAIWLAKKFDHLWKPLGLDWDDALAEMRFIICRCALYYEKTSGSFSNYCTYCARRYWNTLLEHHAEQVSHQFTNAGELDIEADDRARDTASYDFAHDSLQAVFRLATDMEIEAAQAVLLAGSCVQAAKRLGITRQNLSSRLKRLGSRYQECLTRG